MYAFSVWIIHDQINMAWFALNADRTRRTFEDFWLFRLLYVGLLFIPFFYEKIPYRVSFGILGISLFFMWIISLYKVYRHGVFLNRPIGIDFLRNIVYLSSRYIKKR